MTSQLSAHGGASDPLGNNTAVIREMALSDYRFSIGRRGAMCPPHHSHQVLNGLTQVAAGYMAISRPEYRGHGSARGSAVATRKTLVWPKAGGPGDLAQPRGRRITKGSRG